MSRRGPAPDAARLTTLHTTIAGIPIPDSRIAREATEFVQDVSTALLFDHSRRVFLWGSLHGEQLGLDYDPELLLRRRACSTTSASSQGHRSEHERFEIDGANAARALPRAPRPARGARHDRVGRRSPCTPRREIPRYKQPEVRLVNWGVEYDIPGRHFDDLTAEQRDAVIAAHPRPGFKEGILEALADGLRDKPGTAYAPWQVDLLERWMPGYVRPNFCDVVRHSRFTS